MKCPLLTLLNMPAERSKGILGIDCIKEKCAWWERNSSCCAVQSMALDLCDMECHLQDIAVKMPHAGQFTK